MTPRPLFPNLYPARGEGRLFPFSSEGVAQRGWLFDSFPRWGKAGMGAGGGSIGDRRWPPPQPSPSGGGGNSLALFATTSQRGSASDSPLPSGERGWGRRWTALKTIPCARIDRRGPLSPALPREGGGRNTRDQLGKRVGWVERSDAQRGSHLRNAVVRYRLAPPNLLAPSPFGGRQGWGPAAVASETAVGPHPNPPPEGEGAGKQAPPA
jgi:hypothetical protein